MSKIYEITARYGNEGKNETNCFVYETRHGCWYVAEGSVNVNFVPMESLEDGVWLEELQDTDCFTWSKPIDDVDEFQTAVEF